MAKILVADDNSNVQKTVALALADLGIEVVAVNNGEAAVRKLADISPDLVLADIFMPVRNGYEVCEYVKKDARFSHLPVVLLVGAFDPLDEREAQRVGADGILKKPFVPPDPLITMVKMLLERTLGDRLVAVAASEPAAAMRSKAGGIATAEEPPSPSIALTPEELPEEEFRPPVERLSFGDGARPMAFGELLDAPAEESAAAGTGAIEPVEDEQILTSSRDASLGDPIFWRTEEPEPESGEENSEADPDISSGLPLRAWKPDEEAVSRNAEADFLQPVEPVEPFELVRDDRDVEASQGSTVVETSDLNAQDAASQASLTVETAKPEDLAANPLDWMASAPSPPAEEISETPQNGDAAATEAGDDTEEKTAENLISAPEATAPEMPPANYAPVTDSAPALRAAPSSATPVEQPRTPIAAEIPDPLKTHPSLHPLAQSAEKTAPSISKQDWADLAASFQTKPVETVAEKTEPAPAPVAQAPALPGAKGQPALENSAPPDSKLSNQSAEDTARSIPKDDWAGLTASLQPRRTESGSEKLTAPPVAESAALSAANALTEPAALAPNPAANAADAQPAQANSATPAPPDPALVEAVVQRILEKMRPQVVDIITKEFLRPIVQALVHREIQKR